MSSTADHLAQLVLSVFLIVGVHQFYFWCQTNPFAFKTRLLLSPLDRKIPYRPAWVWIYSFLYYPVILAITLTTQSPRHFLYVAVSYVALLAAQMALFLTFPVVTPDEWRLRPQTSRSRSERFLTMVQGFDAPGNSFPSMHTSVAVLTAFHLQSSLGAGIFVFPLLIALSCLFTKQHYLIDLPAGALLGWGSFLFFNRLF